MFRLRWYQPPPAGRLDHELIWGAPALAMFIIAALPPAALRWAPFFYCPFKQLTGLPCCLCGGTHAIQDFVRGRWGKSWVENPLAFGIGMGAALFLVYAVVAVVTGRRWRPRVSPRRAALLLLIAAALLVAANWTYLIVASG